MFQRIFSLLCVMLLSVAAVARADFILWNDEQKRVTSRHQEGNLYDTSRADIVAGGEVDELNAHDSSTVDVSGGSMYPWAYAYNESTVTISSGTVGVLHSYNSSKVDVLGGTASDLRPHNESTVNISGGSVSTVFLHDSSTLNMSDGSVEMGLIAYGSNTVAISGGSVRELQVVSSGTTVTISGGTIDRLAVSNNWPSPFSSVTLNVKNYRLGGGLTLEGDRLLGTGILSGQWTDDSPRWDIDITANSANSTRSGAGIFISQVPEPIAILQAGDADQDFDFDQLDLVQVQVAAKYLTGQPATWGEGDWNGAPGGSPGSPPPGDGVFDNLDIVAALQTGNYLQGPYAAAVPEPSSFVLLVIAVGLLVGAWRGQA